MYKMNKFKDQTTRNHSPVPGEQREKQKTSEKRDRVKDSKLLEKRSSKRWLFCTSSLVLMEGPEINQTF